jgi:hypothetical protein
MICKSGWSPQGELPVRDMRDRDRESCAGFQSFGFVPRLALKTNYVEAWLGRNHKIDGWTST